MIKKIIVFVSFLLFTSSFSQKNNISPYSFFGIGAFSESKTVNEHSMGIGTALNSPHKLYFSNPASIASLRFTTYTLGLTNTFTKIDDGVNDPQESSAFALSYIALGFPVGEKAGVSFGLQPYSKVGYSISQNTLNDDDETESSLYKGTGRTNKVFLNYGQKLPYNINIGIETSYVFGNLERSILSRNNDRIDQRASYYKTDTNIKGLSFKIGAQHMYKLNDKLNIQSGISLLLENTLSNIGNEKLVSLANSTNPDRIIFGFDKQEIFNRDFDGTITMPLKTAFSTGVGSSKKWFVGVEYDFQNANSFTDNFSQRNGYVKHINKTNLAFGGFYIPKATSITKYWERITYEAGFHLKQVGLEIENTAIKDFGMSFGVSLPSKKQLSNINLGFDIGKRGEINNNGLIKENYYNFRLSLSFNDKWFRKRKLN